MVTRYVWWDEKQKLKRRRVDLRVPEPLHDFVSEVAKVHGVSVNAVICGVLAYVAERRPGLVITVEPFVRVQENRPAESPAVVTVPEPTPADRKRWNRGKVL